MISKQPSDAQEKKAFFVFGKAGVGAGGAG